MRCVSLPLRAGSHHDEHHHRSAPVQFGYVLTGVPAAWCDAACLLLAHADVDFGCMVMFTGAFTSRVYALQGNCGTKRATIAQPAGASLLCVVIPYSYISLYMVYPASSACGHASRTWRCFFAVSVLSSPRPLSMLCALTQQCLRAQARDVHGCLAAHAGIMFAMGGVHGRCVLFAAPCSGCPRTAASTPA